MEETKKKVDKIKDTKDRLVEALAGQIANGVEGVDADEAGKVTDMIKDLAEAEKECWEACYYKSIVEAMDKESKETERMGYDAWRYANGEYAPKGRGTRGYTPVRYDDGMTDDPMRADRSMATLAGYTRPMNTRMGHHEDPIEELAELWKEADHDTKVRMKSALEEMAQQIGD